MAVTVVDVVEVRDATYRIAKVGTSGYDVLADWLAKANEAQLDLLNMLTPWYGKVTAVDDILSPLIKEATATFTSGVLNMPSDYYGFVSMWKSVSGVTKKVPKIKTNMIGTYMQDTVRMPTVTDPKFYMRGGNFVLLPSNGDAGITMIYVIKPPDVSITETPVEDADDDYTTVTAQTNFIWPYRAKNLLIYVIAQRLCMEMKQPILFELSQLGIKESAVVDKANQAMKQ